DGAMDRPAAGPGRKLRQAMRETVGQIGGAESQAVFDRVREVFDRQIFAPGDAVHVAVIDPHGVHAAPAQFVEPLFERACHPPSPMNATTKTRKHEDTKKRTNKKKFLFVLSGLRGPGAVLAVVLSMSSPRSVRHQRAL